MFMRERYPSRLNVETRVGRITNQGSQVPEQFFSTRGSQGLEAFGVVTSGLGELLLASRGYRPGILPNILQCTGQPLPHNKELSGPMAIVSKLRDPLPKEGKKHIKNTSDRIAAV